MADLTFRFAGLATAVGVVLLAASATATLFGCYRKKSKKGSKKRKRQASQTKSQQEDGKKTASTAADRQNKAVPQPEAVLANPTAAPYIQRTAEKPIWPAGQQRGPANNADRPLLSPTPSVEIESASGRAAETNIMTVGPPRSLHDPLEQSTRAISTAEHSKFKDDNYPTVARAFNFDAPTETPGRSTQSFTASMATSSTATFAPTKTNSRQRR